MIPQNASQLNLKKFAITTILAAFVGVTLSSCGGSSRRYDRPPGVNYGSVPGRKPAPTQSEYRLQVGDNIDVFVIEDPTFNGSYPVRQSGDIIIPKHGRIAVAGKRLAEAESVIKDALQSSQLRQATVIVDPGARRDAQELVSKVVVVRLSGRVMKTGRTSIPQVGDNPVTAFQAVMDVGGFAPFADKRKSYIIRVGPSGTSRIPVNFETIEAGRAQDLPLLEGDSIVVPQKAFGF